ncbi:MAG: PepSY domain-containing protein [Defluviitaleaceae bacterium]|nr:PepSY domain-containing protein [Defluviitaleaceae bacterium]
MSKYIIILGVLVVAAAFMFWPSNISRREAQELAVAHVGGGHANPAERDFERLQRAWSVEVFYSGLVHEVYVNSRTGAIIRVEVDRWD